jgi:hypothetical protein
LHLDNVEGGGDVSRGAAKRKPSQHVHVVLFTLDLDGAAARENGVWLLGEVVERNQRCDSGEGVAERGRA